MLKKKSLKTILIIFALITAIGVTSSLFGGSRPGKTSSGGSSSGSGGHKHEYSAYNVCKDCGYSNKHTQITRKVELNEETDYYWLDDFDHSDDTCALLVLFNQGTENENGYYVLYDGTDSFTSDDFGFEMQLHIEGEELCFDVGSTDFLIGKTDVTVYIADPTSSYVSFYEVYRMGYFDSYSIYVDGKEVTESHLVAPVNKGFVMISNVAGEDLVVEEREFFADGCNEIVFDSEGVATYIPSFKYSYVYMQA